MSIEIGIFKRQHSSGVLCLNTENYSKARKYVDTIGSDTSTPLAMFPNLANYRVYR